MAARSVRTTTLRITIAAIFMAMNIALSSFGIPVPGGCLYLCDVIICMSGILLRPAEAFAAGGIGSFIGDIMFYPLTMFVSLFTHGLQAAVISLISHNTLKDRPKLASGTGAGIGAVIMVAGYTCGKAFIYGTPEMAVTTIPYDAIQAVTGAVLGMLLCHTFGISRLFHKITDTK